MTDFIIDILSGFSSDLFFCSLIFFLSVLGAFCCIYIHFRE